MNKYLKVEYEINTLSIENDLMKELKRLDIGNGDSITNYLRVVKVNVIDNQHLEIKVFFDDLGLNKIQANNLSKDVSDCIRKLFSKEQGATSIPTYMNHKLPSGPGDEMLVEIEVTISWS